MCIHIDKTCKNTTLNKTRANILMKSRRTEFELRKSLSIFINAIYFSIIAMPKKFYYFRDTKLCVKHKKTHMNCIYIIGFMFVREMNGA